MFATKVKHLLRFGDTPDGRAREAATLEYKAKGWNGKRLRWCANEDDMMAESKAPAACGKALGINMTQRYKRLPRQDSLVFLGCLNHLITILTI